MSKATDFVRERTAALAQRPTLELKLPDKDQLCLFRVGRNGHLEYHTQTTFSVLGEDQGETYPCAQWSSEEALKLADWIQKTFK